MCCIAKLFHLNGSTLTLNILSDQLLAPAMSISLEITVDCIYNVIMMYVLTTMFVLVIKLVYKTPFVGRLVDID